MRLNVHDFSGHPFQVQLSRELARRGHQVLHEYASQYVSGRGRLTLTADDPATLRIDAVTADREIAKYDPVGRARFELAYARAWRTRLEREPHDLVVACNVPLFAMARMRRYFERRRQPWVFWHQDIYSLGVSCELRRRLPAPVAGPLTGWAESMERAQLLSADRVVAIGNAFIDRYRQWGLPIDHATVRPNWAPLDDIVPGARDNDWTRAQRLDGDRVRLLYSGTLGRKHNPLLLLDLLDATRAQGVNAELLVCSEGDGADVLAAAAANRADVKILGYQPAESFADVLAGADVMVALLEPDAAVFSVPSKVLSYLSAGRPIVALMPDGNDAAADVREAGGFVGTPDTAGARTAGGWIAETVAEAGALVRLGERSRELARRRFDITTIADEFEQVFAAAVGQPATVLPDARDAAIEEVRG